MILYICILCIFCAISVSKVFEIYLQYKSLASGISKAVHANPVNWNPESPFWKIHNFPVNIEKNTSSARQKLAFQHVSYNMRWGFLCFTCVNDNTCSFLWKDSTKQHSTWSVLK